MIWLRAVLLLVSIGAILAAAMFIVIFSQPFQ